jgi:aspartate kinase
MTGKIAVGGITRTDDLVLIRVLGAPASSGLEGRALSALGNKGVNIICVTSFLDRDGLNNLCFTINHADLDQALGILQSLQDDIKAHNIECQRHCSVISIYGPHFSERPAIGGTVFESMGEARVDVLMIATSLSTVSFVTNEKQAADAVAKLHENFLVP